MSTLLPTVSPVCPLPLAFRQDARTHALTGPSRRSVWALTNSAAGAPVPTGGGLGGCRRVVVVGEVRATYSDRSVSNWGTQEPTGQTRELQTAATWRHTG